MERKIRRLELETEAKARRLKAEEIREAKVLEAKREEAEKNMIFELEKTRIEVNSPHGLKRGEGVMEDTVEVDTRV